MFWWIECCELLVWFFCNIGFNFGFYKKIWIYNVCCIVIDGIKLFDFVNWICIG